MGSCQAGHNLHLCLAHHPPLVCANLILLLLGLSGLGLGRFLLTHRTSLRSPDIPQDWVSFLRSFGQLTLCPVNGTVIGKWHGSHVVGLLTTLNFGDGLDRNKTQTFQAKVLGSQIGLKGSSAGEQVLVTARVTTERTPGTCLYFSTAPGILPPSQPPIPCSEEGAGNATLSPRMAEECIRVWSHEGFVLTKLLTSMRKLAEREGVSCPRPQHWRSWLYVAPGCWSWAPACFSSVAFSAVSLLCASTHAGSPTGLEPGSEGPVLRSASTSWALVLSWMRCYKQ
ncbi:insulin-like growth factor-binding protein 3 receptor isoform X2 [Choloepus didactylus]|nr:insulin-like growth factor-binding protein 3 receptor isoform X2 [Choloepus didactylus]XP_037671114.1 insulin-like growth factor-binding protein 3 receptor isoform X2 [Choloepus didactylus]XP_037671115.1 insulin-like growth factor-binding protein 3 receptor isoform X2 [Choloepus didactylus]XP_037671116.1 insulin-like growth factor-binding protein 3 receptor isoform X2 [Choloepus didactylus]XP_037671117.1 insulin-like growth factor-binding protein 3 receptor isoform X2 [Choloepus didactylus]